VLAFFSTVAATEGKLRVLPFLTIPYHYVSREMWATLAPAGPLGLGAHTVVLTGTDSHGASASSSAIVTVIDQTAPTITKVSANPSIIWPPDRRMADVLIAMKSRTTAGKR
jgi:hypothetical protein